MDKSTQNLFKIIRHGDHQALQKLADDGVDLNVSDEYGSTLLHYAAHLGSVECLELLLRLGVYTYSKVRNKEGMTAVYAASEAGQVECLEILISHSLDINIPNNNGATPVYIATQNGHDECLELLAKHGANLDTPEDKFGYAPIHLASRLKNPKCLKVLCKYGVNVSLAKDDGGTAAHVAVTNGKNGKVNFLKLLAKYGMDFSIKRGNIYTSGKSTALDLAKKYNSAKCAEFLSAL